MSILLILSCGHRGTKDAAQKEFPNDEVLLKQYSTNQLNEALTIMRVVLDQGKKEKNKEFCEITLEEASLMSQQIRFLMEEKISEEKAPTTVPENWKACEKTCTCYLYSRIYSDENDFFLKKLKAVTNVDAYNCAKKSTWFCGSPLHQDLKKLSVIPESSY